MAFRCRGAFNRATALRLWKLPTRGYGHLIGYGFNRATALRLWKRLATQVALCAALMVRLRGRRIVRHRTGCKHCNVASRTTCSWSLCLRALQGFWASPRRSQTVSDYQGAGGLDRSNHSR